MRLQAGIAFQERPRRQPLQIGQPLGVLRQQHQRIRRKARVVGTRQADLAADDRLDTLAGARLAEFQRTEQIAAVGDRYRRHAGIPGQSGDLVRLDRPLAERIGAMDSEMDEIGVGHTLRLEE